MSFQERYLPKVVAVDTAVKLYNQNSIGGFLPKTAGTITIVDSYGVTIVNAVAVTAGIYVPLPFALGSGSTIPTFTTAGGASGTIAM